MDTMEELVVKLIGVSIILFIFFKLFLWQFWQMIRDEVNLKLAKKELPELADEMNLKRKKDTELGTYTGVWKKHMIRIEPNTYRTSIGIKINRDPQFSAKHEGISEKFDIIYIFHFLSKFIIRFMPEFSVNEESKPKFDFNDQILDKYFQRRKLLSNDGEKIACNFQLKEEIKAFIEKHAKKIKNLYIDSEISCSLWVGSSSTKSRNYSVTAKQVKYMLEEMLPVAEKLERLLK
ncbi:MAG: hypothetical protein APR63_01710 [Desulfuromonas sp. SDB]|nr:MAG: hypothetical protein APR63_01710 [Desulfuromonas sp. SDB]